MLKRKSAYDPESVVPVEMDLWYRLRRRVPTYNEKFSKIKSLEYNATIGYDENT